MEDKLSQSARKKMLKNDSVDKKKNEMSKMFKNIRNPKTRDEKQWFKQWDIISWLIFMACQHIWGYFMLEN